ncbi:MAG: type II toxin-antitoxin system Phd/YefM family antitoxin [Gemmatimonadota bacterium]|nr:type II toxin-antitoxin system Phd/YefM family antitoxin [Gemmatimonadota bacterium]MDE2983231.1 type II toxin-antitoxin system Phd/YefM family antitoxin [Gemmatimonadota bacterium]
MPKVAATKLRTTISDLLDRVVHHGERVAVERYGKPVAALVSPEDLELLEAIENRMDIEMARKALNEPGRRSWDEVRTELALQDDPEV